MKIKFDSPMPLEKARELYNDNVKFVSSVVSYPHVEGIEFNGDMRHIFKKKYVSPKANKLAKKIETKYGKKLNSIWNRAFKAILSELAGPKKQDEIKVSDSQKSAVAGIISSLSSDLSDAAKKPYEDAYKLGKLRGQIISNQEMDHSLDNDDQAEIEKELDDNEEYLAGFSKDLQADMDKIMDEPYDTIEELESAVKDEVQEPKKARLNMYTAAITGLIVAGLVAAMQDAKPEEGEVAPEGGYWTNHPEEGFGGNVCDGCERLNGQWMTWDRFNQLHGNQDCLSRCRCELEP